MYICILAYALVKLNFSQYVRLLIPSTWNFEIITYTFLEMAERKQQRKNTKKKSSIRILMCSNTARERVHWTVWAEERVVCRWKGNSYVFTALCSVPKRQNNGSKRTVITTHHLAKKTTLIRNITEENEKIFYWGKNTSWYFTFPFILCVSIAFHSQ